MLLNVSGLLASALICLKGTLRQGLSQEDSDQSSEGRTTTRIIVGTEGPIAVPLFVALSDKVETRRDVRLVRGVEEQIAIFLSELTVQDSQDERTAFRRDRDLVLVVELFPDGRVSRPRVPELVILVDVRTTKMTVSFGVVGACQEDSVSLDT